MPHIPRVVCGQCNIEMRCLKNSVRVEMIMVDGESYYKIDSDRWGCPKCLDTVLTGFAKQPFAQHWEPDYAEKDVDVSCWFRS